MAVYKKDDVVMDDGLLMSVCVLHNTLGKFGLKNFQIANLPRLKKFQDFCISLNNFFYKVKVEHSKFIIHKQYILLQFGPMVGTSSD